MDYFNDLFFVNSGSCSPAPPVIRSSGFTYWGIQFCLRGRLHLRIGDGEEEQANGPVAFLSFPGPAFRYSTDPDRVSERLYCCFSGERVARWKAGGLLTEKHSHAMLFPESGEAVTAYFLELLQLLKQVPSPARHARAVLLTEQILLLFAEGPKSAGERAMHLRPELERLAAAIDSDPSRRWDTARMASETGVSEAHFRRIFQQCHGVPPGAYILESRLKKAARLLSETRLKLSAVALECGFRDEFYFSRIFRKHRNLSPGAYRKEFYSSAEPGKI